MKKALITGITGQDGAYLAEFLLEKGYEVHGMKRRSSSFNTERIDHIFHHERLKLHHGDLSDSTNVIRIIYEINPDEIYNLGAMSHVKVSFEMPEYVAQVDGLGILRILEAVRLLGLTTKIYQASTSELFGSSPPPQSEKTPFYPRSPYAAAKLYAYWITVNYREAYNMFACNGILFNHESPFRGETFVTRKITRGVARITNGLQDKIYLGNLDAKRDWGHAKDYVEAMWLMLQQDKPVDYVIATGQSYTIREFLEMAFLAAGMEITFKGEGLHEVGIVNGREGVAVDPRYFRPTEVDHLEGFAFKAWEDLKWRPKCNLGELAHEMIKADLEQVQKEILLKKGGFKVYYQES